MSANIIAVDAVYDGSNTIHVLVKDTAGRILDYPFDLPSSSFRASRQLASGNPVVSGDYMGSGGISGLIDLAGVLHVAYWSAGDHIAHVAYTYAPATNVLTTVSAAVQVDQSNRIACHPVLAVSPVDNAVTVAWVSPATNSSLIGGDILARTRSGSGSWGAVEKVNVAAAWTSTYGGIDIDQGPSLLVDGSGRKHLSYIEHFDSTGDYGRIHYVSNNGAGWVDQALDAYSHDPALAINSAGQLYIIGHGHPRNQTCLAMEDMCLKRRNADGTWGPTTLYAAHVGADSFDSSPSVKWSVVGFSNPETIEFVFFSAVNGSYIEVNLYYGRIAP